MQYKNKTNKSLQETCSYQQTQNEQQRKKEVSLVNTNYYKIPSFKIYK